MIADSIRDNASSTALVAPGRPDLTYVGLGQALDYIIALLADAGFGPGMRIGIAMPDGPEMAAAILAVCSIATCAPLNPALDEAALARLLVAMRLDALVVGDGTPSAVEYAARRTAVTVVTLRKSLGDAAINVLRQTPDRASVTDPTGDAIALLMHTSGTTAAPKIVPLEQWRVAETIRHRIELSRIDESDRCLVAMPLHSSAGIRRMLAGVSSGGSVICPGALPADATIELLETLAPTQYMAPPASHIALVEAFERRVPRPHHRLKAIWSGTTDLPEAVRARMEQVLGVPVIVAYGATESGSISQAPYPPERAPAGSVGRATNIDIAIADDAGRRLEPEASGEIVVRGPEVFAGYENDEAANRAAFRDGWYRTGDAGRIDRDGFLYVSGRLTEVINRGGMKIAPIEVEAALALHPQVIEAAAFAVPHPTLGHDLAAAVVVRDRVDESELRRFLRASLSTFKIPSRIIEVPALPRGGGGKVTRGELAALVAASAPPGGEPPAGRVETEVARIFALVLGVPVVGRRESFFDLGGDSLSAMRVLTEIDAAFGVPVPMEMLFDSPTVAEFAAAVSASSRANTTTPVPSLPTMIRRRR